MLGPADGRCRVITGRIRYRLTDNRDQQRDIRGLDQLPDGAEVVLAVPGRRWPTLDLWLLNELREHQGRLKLVIEADDERIILEGKDELEQPPQLRVDPWLGDPWLCDAS